MAGEDVKQFALPASVLIAAALISGTILYTKSPHTDITGSPTATPIKLSVVPDDHILGNPQAKVTIYEFSDFQCPFCRSFFEHAYVDIKQAYIDTGKVRLVYRHNPLTDLHPAAMPAAIAAECAGEQGKFWEMHDKIFDEQLKRNPQELADPKALHTIAFTAGDLQVWARDIGLDMTAYSTCVGSGRFNARIQRDVTTAASLQFHGTPMFVLDGIVIEGAQPFESTDPGYTPFKPAIEAALR